MTMTTTTVCYGVHCHYDRGVELHRCRHALYRLLVVADADLRPFRFYLQSRGLLPWLVT